jgi:queuine tRNA-ribosyltransferase
MLAAGLFVAKGRATGPKSETTVGLSPAAASNMPAHELLGSEWLSRWQRSDAKLPLGVDANETTWLQRIMDHPQFHRMHP